MCISFPGLAWSIEFLPFRPCSSIMDILQTTHCRIHPTKLADNTVLTSLNCAERICFASLLTRKRNGRFFCGIRSRSLVDDKNGGGFVIRSRDEAQDAAIMVGTDRDSSSSVFGSNSTSQSATIDEQALEAQEIVINGVNQLSGETEKGDEDSIRTVYNVVFVTAEASPYSKTGGLGDVCGSLPITLAARGHRVMVISPRYMDGSLSDKRFANAVPMEQRAKIYCFGGEEEVVFFHEYRAGVDWIFVDHPAYHRPGNPYGDTYGAFGDNQFRFTLLCYAACEAPLLLPLGGYTYGEKCMFLANDWHAGLVPVLLAAKYRPYGVYKNARSITIIHNLAHQGVEPAATFKNLGLPSEWYKALEWVFPTWARAHALDLGEAVNVLKAAIVTADRIVAVSQGYSWEITTPEGGYGLHELLSNRKVVLTGITNGIDAVDWNPSTDRHIASNYSISDLSGKAECKSALQRELGLPVRPDCPLIGFIGRLDYQKGVDVLLSAAPDLMRDDVQLVMLGSGERQYEDWMRHLESTYKDKYRGWVGFDVPISHRITAGCDILAMPSRFEPCGLNQLYAMKYGTIPVVHETGGLRDTVKTFNPYAKEGMDEGTGWVFSPLSNECLLSTLRIAVKTYKEYKPSWAGLMKRGMERDSSWDKAAAQYEQVFEWAFIDPPYAS